jgi:hypothetical protein
MFANKNKDYVKSRNYYPLKVRVFGRKISQVTK